MQIAMADPLYLDTHAVVWLHDKVVSKFSSKGKKAIEESDLYISPIVLLELEYLFEIDRISFNSVTIVEYLESRVGLRVDEDLKTNRWFVTSLQEKWTRDPFDSLIVSHAKTKGARLLSKDKVILKNYLNAFW
jgi:PIN domain nuclease of toxin-antitoxin system